MSLIMTIRMLGLFMILPVFAVLGYEYQYANEFLIGLAVGIYGLTQGLLQIPFGYLSDKYGRTPLLLIGLVLFAVGSFMSAVSDNIYVVIIGRLIAGAGAIASVIMAFVTDVIPDERRAKTYAFFGLLIGVAFMLAMIISPIIADSVGLTGIFYVTGVLALIAIGVVLSLDKSPPTIQYRLSIHTLLSLLTPKLVSFDISIFSLHFVLTSLFIITPTLLTQDVALSYLLMFVISFILMLPGIIIAQKYAQFKRIIQLAIIVMLVSQYLMIDTSSHLLLVVFLTLFFIGFNLIEALTPTLIAKDIEQNHKGKRGLVMGIYTTSQFFGGFFGGIIAGSIAYFFGANNIFIANIILMAVWLIIISRRSIWQELTK